MSNNESCEASASKPMKEKAENAIVQSYPAVDHSTSKVHLNSIVRKNDGSGVH